MSCKLILLAAAAAFGVAAQTPTSQITVKVPFSFEANGVMLASGTYTVLTAAGRPIVTVVDQATGKRIMMLALGAGDNKERADSLEFKRYKDVYFLTAMNAGSTGQKVSLPYSRREKETAIAIQPEVVVALAE